MRGKQKKSALVETEDVTLDVTKELMFSQNSRSDPTHEVRGSLADW